MATGTVTFEMVESFCQAFLADAPNNKTLHPDDGDEVAATILRALEHLAEYGAKAIALDTVSRAGSSDGTV